MTQCSKGGFELPGHFSRQAVARFDGGAMTSDAGALLLREAGRRIGLDVDVTDLPLHGRQEKRFFHGYSDG